MTGGNRTYGTLLEAIQSEIPSAMRLATQHAELFRTKIDGTTRYYAIVRTAHGGRFRVIELAGNAESPFVWTWYPLGTGTNAAASLRDEMDAALVEARLWIDRALVLARDRRDGGDHDADCEPVSLTAIALSLTAAIARIRTAAVKS